MNRSAHPADGLTVLEPGRFASWVVAALVGGGAVAALFIVAAGSSPDWWRAWAASVAIVLLSAGLSMPLLFLSMRPRSGGEPDEADALSRAVPWVFCGSAARALAVAGGILLAVRVLETPRWPTIGLSMGLYLALLVTEVSLMGRAFWRFDKRRRDLAVAGTRQNASTGP